MVGVGEGGPMLPLVAPGRGRGRSLESVVLVGTAGLMGGRGSWGRQGEHG